jgi:hypothetical protein
MYQTAFRNSAEGPLSIFILFQDFKDLTSPADLHIYRKSEMRFPSSLPLSADRSSGLVHLKCVNKCTSPLDSVYIFFDGFLQMYESSGLDFLKISKKQENTEGPHRRVLKDRLVDARMKLPLRFS